MRVDHEKKSDGVTVSNEKKSNGVIVHHERTTMRKDRWGDS